ncbi:aminotransferase class I/II-fold pyridoxal phosphate-dependent enzyme [Lacibacter luteus]|uniref:Aminotransferase class I/II-fold pyridoxal phosphate-dependent enzyme n=1 Tax=Lacibacter luteus TaxID=2508719 RepID=A0A4Q1CK65_9BACT|nr:aminotransferase class I/II-fold pyridoxal phosphate-dependent enzyme [Lacibacter luteus]RXK60768.1 aminotransferase class I/II-fold pyridoxal phosphate-dependent enzyme [Lacibacter luteus]
MKLSHLSETLVGSEIVKLGNQIKERIRMGERIYNFTIGDFDSAVFPIPQQLEDEIVTAYRQHYTTYPAAEGILELRQAVLQFLKEREGLDYGVNEIQIASGGRPLIYAIFRAIVDKGDKVIYATPSWNNNHYTHFNEAEHVVIEATPETNFMPTAEAIAPHIKGAALLCLCTPQNPTGTMIPRAELEKICDMILEENKRRGDDEKKMYLMFDQMYWTLTFGDNVHDNPVTLRPEMKAYTVFVDGISKVFAATGVRVGWSLGPEYLIGKIKAILSHVGAWAPMAEQKATAVYLLQKENVDSYLVDFKKAIHYRLSEISKGFVQLKQEGFNVDVVAPQGAIYLTIKVDLKGKKTTEGVSLATQADVTNYLLAEAKLAIVPFYAFGADKESPWYRLSVGTCKEEEIPEFLGKLKEAMQKLS